MAGIIRRPSGTYHAQFHDPSKTPVVKRVSLKTSSKVEARRRLAELEQQGIDGHWCPWKGDLRTHSGPTCLAGAIDGFISEKQSEAKRRNTIRTYREVLRGFELSVEHSRRTLDRISAKDVRSFVFAPHLSRATQHKRFSHLKTFLRWAVRTGRIAADRDCLSVEAPRKPDLLPRLVTPHELDRICRAIERDYAAKRKRNVIREGQRVWRIPAFRFCFLTGFRAGEIARLRWRDVDVARRVVELREQKNGRQQLLPLTEAAVQLLSSIEEADPADFVFRSCDFTAKERDVASFVNRFGAAFREARKLAGIERPITPHGLRHGFCSLLARSGASAFTDDTVLTVAVAEAILERKPYQQSILEWGRKYPSAGYGGTFIQWLYTDHPRPYNSWGNGSAMRVSPVGWAFDTREEVLSEAKKTAEITHNHAEGIKGAQATALAVFLARTGSTRDEIRDDIAATFGYDLDRTVDSIRPDYHFDVSCQGTVPEAIIAFLESVSWEDAVRNAVSLGGDSDTLAAITGAISEAFYGSLPEAVVEPVERALTSEMWKVIRRFGDYVGS
jgi:ADP-ribosylglycohydrolase